MLVFTIGTWGRDDIGDEGNSTTTPAHGCVLILAPADHHATYKSMRAKLRLWTDYKQYSSRFVEWV